MKEVGTTQEGQHPNLLSTFSGKRIQDKQACPEDINDLMDGLMIYVMEYVMSNFRAMMLISTITVC